MPISLGEHFSFDQSLPNGPPAGEIESEAKTGILILGAGLAGLSCAFRIAQAHPHPITRNDLVVLEREARVGGRIRSLKIGTRVINLGALTFQPEHYPRYVSLLNELGLESAVREIPRHGMIFGSDGQSLRADNTALAWEVLKGLVGRGLFTTRQAVQLLRFYVFYRHLNSPQGEGDLMALHEMSMLEWSRRFGFDADLQRMVVEPFTRLCFCGPGEVSAAFGVFLLGSNFSHPANLVGGIGQVAEALAGRLDGLIETQALALEVNREPSGFATVYLQQGRLRRLHSRIIVIAVPASVASRLVPELRERASAIQYGAGRGTIVSGKLKTPAELHIWRVSRTNQPVVFGGEAQADGNGGQYLNVLTYAGRDAIAAARELFVDEHMEQLADYSIWPAVAAPRPGQKPPPLDWGNGFYLAGDWAGLFPSQETAVNSGEHVANLLKQYV
jgi:phytoene dehydrogenase-like protein